MSDYDSIESLQADGLIDSKKVATIKIWLVMFFHTCICGVLLSNVFAIWLDKQIHLDSLEIGKLLAMKGLIAVFYKPLFGWIIDRTQLRPYFMYSLAILGLLAGPFFQFVYKPLLLTHNPTLFYMAGMLGGIYFGYVVIAGGSAAWTYCGRYIIAHNGTEDKVSSASLAGWLVMDCSMSIIYTFSPMSGFYFASFSAVFMILVLASLKVKPFNNLETRATSKQNLKLVDFKYLVLNPRFYVLVLFSLSIFVACASQFAQLGRYALYFWPQDHQNFALRFNGIISVPVHLLVTILMLRASGPIKRLKPSRALIICALGFALCFVFFGISARMHDHMTNGHYIPSLVASLISRQLIVFVNPVLPLVALTYVNMSFNKKIVSSAFLMGFHFVATLGSSVGNVVEGDMFKTQGWANAYFELAGYVFVASIVVSIVMIIVSSYEKKRVMSHVIEDSDTSA